jgi:hypothetical protein
VNVATIKAAVRERDGYRCTECGMTHVEHVALHGRALEVHRVVPGSKYTVEGAVTLCKACHGSKPKRKQGQPDLKRPGLQQPLFVEIEPVLREALDDAVAFERRTLTTVVSIALEEHLERLGLWPPSED